MAVTTYTIPLFPLDVVLFPGMLLPLHIFEPRYRRMVRNCITRGEPFGLVWAEEEPLILDPAAPLVGTTAVITEVEALDDGRYNITTVGKERFCVRALSHDEPYLVGHVESYPYRDSASREPKRYRASLVDHLERYVEQLNRIASNEVELEEIPEDPATLAHLAAVYYQCQNWRKQELLNSTSLAELMKKEIELLSLEIPLLEQIAGYQQRGESPPFIAGSLALYGLS